MTVWRSGQRTGAHGPTCPLQMVRQLRSALHAGRATCLGSLHFRGCRMGTTSNSFPGVTRNFSASASQLEVSTMEPRRVSFALSSYICNVPSFLYAHHGRCVSRSGRHLFIPPRSDLFLCYHCHYCFHHACARPRLVSHYRLKSPTTTIRTFL